MNNLKLILKASIFIGIFAILGIILFAPHQKPTVTTEIITCNNQFDTITGKDSVWYDCMLRTDADWTDGSCAYCDYLTKYFRRDIAYIDTLTPVGESDPLYNIQFADSSGLNSLSDYELNMILEHTVSPI